MDIKNNSFPQIQGLPTPKFLFCFFSNTFAPTHRLSRNYVYLYCINNYVK